MKNLPNKVEPIKPNYHEDDAMVILEKYYDEWVIHHDWWHGSDTWDLNVYRDIDTWYVCIYGLVRYDSEELLQTDTSYLIDRFELKL